jgi:hypothetical protein
VVASTNIAEAAKKTFQPLCDLDRHLEGFSRVMRGTQRLNPARDRARRRPKRPTTGEDRSGIATPAHSRTGPGRDPSVGAVPSAPGTCSAGQRTATITALTTHSKNPYVSFLRRHGFHPADAAPCRPTPAVQQAAKGRLQPPQQTTRGAHHYARSDQRP